MSEWRVKDRNQLTGQLMEMNLGTIHGRGIRLDKTDEERKRENYGNSEQDNETEREKRINCGNSEQDKIKQREKR